jgi:hypothetical protein
MCPFNITVRDFSSYSLVPGTLDNNPSNLASDLTLQALKNKKAASFMDQTLTAAVESCTLNGKSVEPKTVVRDAKANAPVPNKSKWYCILGKVRLIPIPNRLMPASTAL